MSTSLRTLTLACAAALGLPACAQDKPASPAPSPSAPAASPAAPSAPPEVRTYCFGLLLKGPKWTAEESPEVKAVQEQHMANIRRLGASGQLVLAGPAGAEGGELRGIFVFDVPSLEEAQKLAATDPAVQAGRLRVELHPWVGTKGIADRAKRAAGGAAPPEMIVYHLVLAKTGRFFDASNHAENRQLGQARLQFLQELEASGRLVLAGPFTDGGTYSGLLVLKESSTDVARLLASNDPAVKTERVAIDVHPWWLPKGLLD